MPIDDIYSKPLPLIDPTLVKAVTPLTPEAVTELGRIQGLTISDYNEQEVRSNVIDPVLRILGYSKGTDFSVDEGRPIRILEKDIFPDYKLHMWQQNFWIIEAKRPRKAPTFAYADLSQALEYAVHPSINATLVVLCDGDKFQIFDREVSLTEPALHIDRANLVRDFHKLQAFLEPMQVWFFEKRRVARTIDKVFDKEFNLQRVEEFRSFIDRRLSMKRNIVLENFRKYIKPDDGERIRHLSSASVEDLIEAHMFMVFPTPQMNTMLRRLAQEAQKNAFHVFYRMLPEEPRDANDPYYAHALGCLLELGRGQPNLNHLPVWLAGSYGPTATLDGAIKKLLLHCLTHFEADPARKVILLASAAFKRLFKILAIGNDQQWKIAELMHVAQRYQAPELSWQQIMSSPEGHLLGRIEISALDATSSFVRSCRTDSQAFTPPGPFKVEVAKMRLRELWKSEIALLKQIGNYGQLRQERNLGDMQNVESRSVSHDFLGHMSLCVMHGHDKWKEYALKEHHPQLEELAALGSWSARKLLGIADNAAVERLPDQRVADRFFYGNVDTLRALREAYRGAA